MKDTVAYRYALALYDLAKETNKIDIWQEQMRLVKKVFVKDRSLKTFFDNHQISKGDKKNILKKAFVNDVDKEVGRKNKELVQEMMYDFFIDDALEAFGWEYHERDYKSPAPISQFIEDTLDWYRDYVTILEIPVIN